MTVVILNNNVGAAATVAGDDGSFAASVPLQHGDNHLKAREENSCGTVAGSNTIIIRRDGTETFPPPPETAATPPAIHTLQPLSPVVAPPDGSSGTDPNTEQSSSVPIDIDHLKEGSVVRGSQVWVAGMTVPFSTVDITVNSAVAARVAAGREGAYGALVQLGQGDNTIIVSTTTPDGLTSSRTIHVISEPIRVQSDSRGGVRTSAWLAVVCGAVAIIGVGFGSAWFARWRLHWNAPHGKGNWHA